MSILDGLLKKINRQRMNGSLSSWEEDILKHYYQEPVRTEMTKQIRKFKAEYRTVYGEFPGDRIMLAVYKLGKSKHDKLKAAFELARSDYRDLLVAAKFANNIDAHKAWKADLMQSITNRGSNEKGKC